MLFDLDLNKTLNNYIQLHFMLLLISLHSDANWWVDGWTGVEDGWIKWCKIIKKYSSNNVVKTHKQTGCCHPPELLACAVQQLSVVHQHQHLLQVFTLQTQFQAFKSMWHRSVRDEHSRPQPPFSNLFILLLFTPLASGRTLTAVVALWSGLCLASYLKGILNFCREFKKKSKYKPKKKQEERQQKEANIDE